MADDITKPTAVPLVVEYARTGTDKLPRRMLVTGIASLCIAAITTVGSSVMAWSWGTSAMQIAQQIAGLPALIAAQNQANAMAAAREANRMAQLQAAATARAKLPHPQPLETQFAEHVIDLLQSQLRVPMSEAQQKSLLNELQKPDQQLVDATLPVRISRSNGPAAPPYQFLLADIGGRAPKTTIRLRMLRSYQTLDDRESMTATITADGNWRIGDVSSPETRLAACQEELQRMSSSTRSSISPDDVADLRADQWAYLVRAFTAAIQLCLSLILLVCGIRALTQRGGWAAGHRMYAWSQLLLVVADAIVWRHRFFTGSRIIDFGLGIPVAALCMALYPVVLMLFLLPSPRHGKT